jgi:hypothetical protein
VDNPDERDQTVERLLRESLKTPASGGATDGCLDAETLAAWADGALSGSALDAVHLHVADCARCQDLAGTLARIRSAVPPAEPERSSRRWLAWFVPVTAAAAAVAIWFAVPGNPGAPAGNRDVALLREAPQAQSEARDSTAPSVSAPAPSDNRKELQAAPSRVPQAAGSLEERARADAAPPPAAEKKAEQESARSNLAKDKLEVEVAQAPAAPATTPPGPPAPAAPRAAAAPPAAERVGATAAMRAANVVPDIVSPDPAVRWRIAGAAVQHSVDGGSTWNAVTVNGAADLTAGTAPAATVCWLVGRAGVVLLTTDGRTFRRLPFPEMTDLSGVRTVDAGGRVASVSTADGRTFVTTDAGASWISR